jgi:hypothetical protein
VAGSCEPGNESVGSIKVKSIYTLHEDTKGKYRQRTVSTSALDGGE